MQRVFVMMGSTQDRRAVIEMPVMNKKTGSLIIVAKGAKERAALEDVQGSLLNGDEKREAARIMRRAHEHPAGEPQ